MTSSWTRLAVTLVALSALPAHADNVAVLSRGYSEARTYANLRETTLTVGLVRPGAFGRLFSWPVEGHVYAQPLYVPELALAGIGARNVLFVATMHNRVYALDADDPGAPPYWTAVLEPPVPLGQGAEAQSPELGSHCGWGTLHDIYTEIGILGTPVIDPVSETIFLVTMSKQSGLYSHWVHALDLTTGTERADSPVQVTAGTPLFAFDSLHQGQRAGLVLNGGKLLIAFAGYCDTQPFQGWLLQYDAANLANPPAVFNPVTSVPNAAGGIWMAGDAPAVDANGDLLLATANGDYNVDLGGQNFGDSVLRLDPSLQVRDHFTPFNQKDLDDTDYDLGSSGLLLAPSSPIVLTAGKQGRVYVLDRGALGGYQRGAGGGDGIRQEFDGFSNPLDVSHHMHGHMVWWDGPSATWLYAWPESDRLLSFEFRFDSGRSGPGRFNPTPAGQGPVKMPDNDMPGGMMSLSAQGSTAGSGILWATTATGNANDGVRPGTLRAFDAADVSRQLWTSADSGNDSLGYFAKFNPPVVTNGKVFVGTFSSVYARPADPSAVVVYGPLDATYTRLSLSTPALGPGEQVTLTATVAGYGTVAATPSGQVVFEEEGGATVATATLDEDGTATAQLAASSGGLHLLRARYLGGGGLRGSVSTAASLVVSSVRTATTLASATNPSSYGSPLTLSAAVSSAGGTPAGTVRVRDGASVIASAQLSGGHASLVVGGPAAPLGVGTHALTAEYVGTADFGPSSSPVVSQTVTRAPTSVSLTPSHNPAVVDTALGFEIRVTSALASPAPAGTVSLHEREVLLGAGALNGAGVATLALDPLSLGSHTLVAAYPGDQRFAPARSEELLQQVTFPPPVVTLTSAPNPSREGEAVRLTAELTGPKGVPTGEVRFRAGANSLGAVAVDSTGHATLSVATLASGSQALVAAYGGDGTYGPTTSAAVTQTITGSTGDRDAGLGSGNGSSAASGCGCGQAGGGAQVLLGLGLVLLARPTRSAR